MQNNNNIPLQRNRTIFPFFLMVASSLIAIFYKHMARYGFSQEHSPIQQKQPTIPELMQQIPENRDLEEQCIQAPKAPYSYVYNKPENRLVYHSLCKPEPSLFNYCAPEAITPDNKALFQQDIDLNFDEYRCSILHVNIANHFYQAALNILTTFPERRDALLNDIDINQRTALHLALEIGAPSDVIIPLITDRNVMMPDKDGITPLMLAARGAEKHVMEKILETIGDDRIHQAISIKDRQNRTVAEWTHMSESEIAERFERVEIDGNKDEKHCDNGLFSHNKYRFLNNYAADQNETAAVYASLGLDVGRSYVKKNPYVAFRATKENVRKLRHIATDDSLEAQQARKKLEDVWEVPAHANGGIWNYLNEKLADIEPSLSGHSLIEVYRNRQQENMQLIHRYKDNASRYFERKILRETVQYQFARDR